MSSAKSSNSLRRSISAAKLLVVAFVGLLVALLFYVGIQGKRHANRQAGVDVILALRDQLQDALDAQRRASGPLPNAQTNASSLSSSVKEWADQLRSQIAKFRDQFVALSESEIADLNLSQATLAVAEQRFSEALLSEAMAASGSSAESLQSNMRDRTAEQLRLYADAYYDQREWAAALEKYQQLLVRRPQLLSTIERMAECQFAMHQIDRARDTYTELADRYQDRGQRLMTELDFVNAAIALDNAVRSRTWLVQQGRQELADDLAQSYSSCGTALVELHRLEPAATYFQQAIDIQAQLINKRARYDLAEELASSHAKYAEVLLELDRPKASLVHLGSAIDILDQLVSQGQVQLRTELATDLSHRGLVQQIQGENAAAARDLERAAKEFAVAGEFGRAVACQEKVLELTTDLTTGQPMNDALVRFEEYKSRKSQQESGSRP